MNTREESLPFVPRALQTPVSAAMKWLDATADKPLELAGLVDTAQALAADDGEPFQLGLVLYDGEICRCERVRFEPVAGEFRFSLASVEQVAVPPLLDPPPGLRRGWLDEQLGKFEFVLLLFYRGRWCPPCRFGLRSFDESGVRDEIRAAGGNVVAVTSEPQTLANEARDDWELRFPAIGDPHHEIRMVLQQRGLLDVFYNADCGHLRERSWVSHPKGYYQPAVIALSQTGRVLYRWRCVPRYSNMSGAGARPEARYTWAQIRAALDTDGDAEIDRAPTLSGVDFSWPANLLAMTAHGWFLRPKAFALGREEDKPSIALDRIVVVVRRRMLGFVAVWVGALLLLPVKIVALAAGLWLAALIPGVIEIHRQFQHEPDP